MRESCRRSLNLAVCGLLMIIGACSTTSISQHLSPDPGDVSFKKIVVVGLFNSRKDREAFEERIAKALRREGCVAVPSLSLIEHGRKYTKEELGQQFAAEGFDAVLVQKILGVEEERTTIPETFYWPGEPFAYSWYSYWWGDGFTDGLGLLMRGGYNEKHDILNVESGFFSLHTEKLVWMARSETTRTKTVASLADQLGPKIAGRLRKDKLIP